MNYKLLTDDDQDDILANTLLAQERDHFCHALNVQRYTELVKVLPEGDYKQRITHLIGTEQAALANVEATLTETSKQLPADATRVTAAATRMKARELASMGFTSQADAEAAGLVQAKR